MKKILPQPIKNPQGFTLVELLVVISIIAILSVIGLTVFSGVQKNARDAKRRGDIEAISKALEAHYNTTQDQNCTAGAAASYCPPLDSWYSSGTAPKDPQTNTAYTVTFTNGNANYSVCATLENPVQQFCRTQQQ